MKNKALIQLYKTSNGSIKVLVQDENAWMTQDEIAELFGKGRTNITEHINNIFKDRELDFGSVMRKLSNVGNSDIGFVNWHPEWVVR